MAKKLGRFGTGWPPPPKTATNDPTFDVPLKLYSQKDTATPLLTRISADDVEKFFSQKAARRLDEQISESLRMSSSSSSRSQVVFGETFLFSSPFATCRQSCSRVLCKHSSFLKNVDFVCTTNYLAKDLEPLQRMEKQVFEKFAVPITDYFSRETIAFMQASASATSSSQVGGGSSMLPQPLQSRSSIPDDLNDDHENENDDDDYGYRLCRREQTINFFLDLVSDAISGENRRNIHSSSSSTLSVCVTHQSIIDILADVDGVEQQSLSSPPPSPRGSIIFVLIPVHQQQHLSSPSLHDFVLRGGVDGRDQYLVRVFEFS